MKMWVIILSTVALVATTATLYAGSGACTKCNCTHWVQKSKYHGSAGEPHAYCKCGHFWDSHR